MNATNQLAFTDNRNKEIEYQNYLNPHLQRINDKIFDTNNKILDLKYDADYYVNDLYDRFNNNLTRFNNLNYLSNIDSDNIDVATIEGSDSFPIQGVKNDPNDLSYPVDEDENNDFSKDDKNNDGMVYTPNPILNPRQSISKNKFQNLFNNSLNKLSPFTLKNRTNILETKSKGIQIPQNKREFLPANLNNAFEEEDEQKDDEPKVNEPKKRGRKPGSKNKPKEDKNQPKITKYTDIVENEKNEKKKKDKENKK